MRIIKHQDGLKELIVEEPSLEISRMRRPSHLSGMMSGGNFRLPSSLDAYIPIYTTA